LRVIGIGGVIVIGAGTSLFSIVLDMLAVMHIDRTMPSIGEA
jgi:hypothetical protein